MENSSLVVDSHNVIKAQENLSRHIEEYKKHKNYFIDESLVVVGGRQELTFPHKNGIIIKLPSTNNSLWTQVIEEKIITRFSKEPSIIKNYINKEAVFREIKKLNPHCMIKLDSQTKQLRGENHEIEQINELFLYAQMAKSTKYLADIVATFINRFCIVTPHTVNQGLYQNLSSN